MLETCARCNECTCIIFFEMRSPTHEAIGVKINSDVLKSDFLY